MKRYAIIVSTTGDYVKESPDGNFILHADHKAALAEEREALLKFVEHDGMCPLALLDERENHKPCSCGLSVLLDRARSNS
jgi:hypothetical protein